MPHAVFLFFPFGSDTKNTKMVILMAIEQTFAMLKPDAVQRGFIGRIISRFEQRGLKLVAMKMIHMDRALAERHYAEHLGKPFYPGSRSG